MNPMLHVLLAAAPAGRQAPAPLYNMFLPMLIVFAIFYFLMIRPQRKKDQARREMLDTVEKGDKVVTIGGIHGQVVSAREKDVTVRVDDDKGVKLKMNRSAISRVIREGVDADDEE